MYYFFGAGNNCLGAINFFGRDNVIAIIDNGSSKTGILYEGIRIISFAEFLQIWKGEKIIITAYICSSEIITQLQKEGIDNFFVCPYMQTGFPSCNAIIDQYELLKYNKIVIYDKNPMTELLAETIKKRKEESCSVKLVDNIHEIHIDAEILLVMKHGCKVSAEISGCKIVCNFYEDLKNNSKYSYLKKYKDIHEGKRCFIIGNGPSLNAGDLEKLRSSEEISFASNRIYKVFSDTKWRPSYYTVADSFVYIKSKEHIPEDVTCFIRDFYTKTDEGSNVNWYRCNIENYYPGYPYFSDNLVEGVTTGRTVTYDMLQIAVYMGFDEIYLLGMDFSWGEDGQKSHFYRSKQEDLMAKESVRYKNEVEHAYVSARKYADMHGIKIYNATRGGKLEVFKRVDFDSLFVV